MEILSYFVSFLGYFPNTTLFSIICACVSSSLHFFFESGDHALFIIFDCFYVILPSQPPLRIQGHRRAV